YPGVNVVYYGNQQRLEYDFDLAAGVAPETIAIRFDGAEKISVNPAGELVIQLDGGQIIQHTPVAYQVVSGEQQAVQAGYKLLDAHTVTFAVAGFNRALPLVIDPVLGYSAFFGGNNGDKAWAIAVDTNNNSIFIAGQTFSTQVSNNIPFTKNGIYTNFHGGAILGEAFVAKFDSTGTNLLFATYLGGNGDNAAYCLAVDSQGQAYVAGTTDATNFPVTNSLSYQNYRGTNIHGVFNSIYQVYPSDAFVTKLSADGSALVYSTYLGGSSWDYAYGITVDENDNAYVTGSTFSSNFPVTLGTAVQTNLACTNNFYVNFNAFVAVIASNGTALNYSTYLGGTNQDVGNAIAYNNGRVFVAGSTTSTNFPWINGLQGSTNLNGFTNRSPGSDAFVSMFKVSGLSLTLQYSTFLGSSNDDIATGIAGDGLGNAYVVGWTTSTNFPNSSNGVTLSSFVVTNTTGFVFATNPFVTKIAWDGIKASNAFSRVFGGLGVDVANGVCLDTNGNVFVVGSASSTNIPVTKTGIFGSLKSTNTGASDVFVTVFKPDFSSLLYSAYLGGKQDDFGFGIALDTDGNAWVTGQTLSTNFPAIGTLSTNLSALHRKMVGTNDAFLTKIVTIGSEPVLSAARSGTNVLVFWPASGDVNLTPAFLGLETATNLLMRNVFTNKTLTTTNIGTNFIFTTNWVVVTNPVPSLINSNFTYIFLDPTNAVRFYRFHPF
ncbi:MAG TPA: SBBP repeat-containing protein, partial [Candidatus Acidoferrales bacterium]|nr:SBBP repeat-containing protein [Candidatus Acidoferrales bacterium]